MYVDLTVDQPKTFRSIVANPATVGGWRRSWPTRVVQIIVQNCTVWQGLKSKKSYSHPKYPFCCSIVRLFSSDRKRVENALENCKLPYGRVKTGHKLIFLTEDKHLMTVYFSWYRQKQGFSVFLYFKGWKHQTGGLHTWGLQKFLGQFLSSTWTQKHL